MGKRYWQSFHCAQSWQTSNLKVLSDDQMAVSYLENMVAQLSGQLFYGWKNKGVSLTKEQKDPFCTEMDINKLHSSLTLFLSIVLCHSDKC